MKALTERAKAVGANIVVFGHTHTAVVLMSDGILFVNPGSLAAPRGRESGRLRCWTLLRQTLQMLTTSRSPITRVRAS